MLMYLWQCLHSIVSRDQFTNKINIYASLEMCFDYIHTFTQTPRDMSFIPNKE